MKKYHAMLQHILDNGVQKGDRTGTGTISTFGYQDRFDLSQGFPLVTTKKIHWKSLVHELLWLISGSTNIKYLKDNGVTIWDEWADENGELGPVYGKQWRKWESLDDQNQTTFTPCDTDLNEMPEKSTTYFAAKSTDQLKEVIERIKVKPDCRRLIVTAWNPADVPKQKLPPCHAFYQFYVANGKLSCHMYQRSADSFLGVPFNIASYALLTHMVAHVCNLEVGEFVHSFGDLHVYSNHIEQVQTQLARECKPLPTVRFARKVESIDDFKFEDIILEGYDPHPAIKAPVAV